MQILMLPSIYFSDFFKDLTVPCTNLKNLVKMSKFEGTVQDIVDAVTIYTNGNELSVSWNGEVLKKLIPEQRQVIVAHLGHILYGYMHCDSNMVKDYIIKAKFHYHVQTLANIEEEPGEFA
jgi:hypothetical protein